MNGVEECFLTFLPFDINSQDYDVKQELQKVLAVNGMVDCFLDDEVDEDDLLDVVQTSDINPDSYIEIVNANLDSLLKG